MEKIIDKTFEKYQDLKKIRNFRETLLKLNSTQVSNLNMEKLTYLLEEEHGETLFWVNIFLDDLKENVKKALKEMQEKESEIRKFTVYNESGYPLTKYYVYNKTFGENKIEEVVIYNKLGYLLGKYYIYD